MKKPNEDDKLQEEFDLSQLPIMPRGRYVPEKRLARNVVKFVWGKTAAQALALAARAHAGQTDKLGAPYLEHCLRVAAKLADVELKTVALLHDVLEDTAVTEAELREMFDSAIVDAVVAITRIEGESAETYYAWVRSNPLAWRVKLADIHDNLEPARFARLDAETQRRLLAKYGAALVALAA